MRKLYFLFSIVIFISADALAQPYGNEWISFSTNQPYSNQQYFRISVWRDGIYRVTYNDLQNASFPSPFNPKQLQLFYMGQEQYIHVEGEADGSFDPGDYIEFYGKKNDGTFDTRLYKDPDHQLNKNFSLFTDTSSYFLTLNINPFTVNRRMGSETDVNFLGYTSIPYVMSESFRGFTYEYNAYRLVEIKDSEFDAGEGWMSAPITVNPVTYTLSVPNISTSPGSPLAVAGTTVMGSNTNGNQHSVTVDVNGATDTSYFYSFDISRFTIPLLSNSSITGQTASFTFTPGGLNNRFDISFIKMNYPHTLSFAGENSNLRKFSVSGNLATGKSYLSMSNVGMQSPRMYMFSGDTLKQISVSYTGGNLQSLVPTYGNDKSCFITDTVYTSSLGFLQITPVNTDPTRFARFINYQYISQADYLIVTHKSLLNKANDYKNYRTSTGYTPLVADVDELYDQFGYGIRKHPLSIRNFCEFTTDTFTLKPGYLLLLGKSIRDTLNRVGAGNLGNAYNTLNWNGNLVPSFGIPPSDLLFATGFNDTLPRPALAVGRIPASTEADVQSYLDKLIAHDLQLQQCPQDWMKQILHFGGGNTGSQQESIKTILKGFENIAEDTLMGAHVTTFLKTSADPIQVNLSQYLQALIDTGCTMMTFVAHASGSTFDISTDLPQNYRNKDRYPLILANSCLVGDIHGPVRKIAEDFVLLPDKGSIAFVAQPDVGYLENLQIYSTNFYQQTAKINYGGTVGRTMQNVIDSMLLDPTVMGNQYSYYIYKSVMLGMTLAGDPALVLNSFNKPDYLVKNSDVYFTPTLITSDLDSFDVNIIVTNLGRSVFQPFAVHIIRKFPDGSLFEKDTTLNYVTYKDTITIRIPVDPVRGVGPNTFDVYVDYYNTVDECDPYNNSALSIPLLIQSSDIIPVYPAEFAIVPSGNISLKASTVNPFTTMKPYVFQIDTVDRFNSPFLKQTIINSIGGVVQWPLPFTLQPDLVYYWRVSRDSLPTDTIHPTWKESSFIHKPGITGWSQAHYSQFKKDDYINVIYSNKPDTTFRFVVNNSQLLVRNYQFPNSIYNPNFEINNVVIDYQMCTASPSMHIVVIDSISLKAWGTDEHYFGNANTYNPQTGLGSCRNRPEYYFIFRMNDPASRDSMYNMLANGIPNGNYVIAYSVFSGKFSQWSPNLINLFSSWGSDSITYLNDTQPYIFFTKKGDNTFTQEAIGDSSRPDIALYASLGGNWSKGFVNSVSIGPAVNWTSLHWDQGPLEATTGADSVAIDVLGITTTGLEVPIPGLTGIQAGNYDLPIDFIDATMYPRLKLRAYLQDEDLYTPPQMNRWQIYYDEIPELALNPARYFRLSKDTVAEGDEIRMEMAVENIGNVNTDSVLVDFYLYDNNRVRHDLNSPRYKTTSPGDTIIASVNLTTNGYPGLNSLWIEANPRQDQPEQYHFNNLAEIKFQVNRDITNPILDVTFDGVHIMNGDIVSGKPVIAIRLKDENMFLALNDTSDWQVFMKAPGGAQTKLAFEPVSCTGIATENMKWCPAQLPNNTFNIEFNPRLIEDGTYELWVQASDVSGNISGSNNYHIAFEVINKSTITEVVNYPNPFSTSTRFVFTLTGSEVPEDFKIQIMTVSGKVVREILRDELGPIHIGRNITDFAWNGKDEFGDQLANGVYLYRVLTRLNGSKLEKRETEADKYFTKGWGKMYLMR